jgi:hypothetical protein
MSVAPNGRIDVVWLDTRNDPGGYDSELYYSYSTDGGVTWSANEQMSEPFNPHVGWPVQQKMGDYFDMVSDDEGAHLAWAGTFNGEQDVYYSHITPDEPMGIACSDISMFLARCNAGGTAQAMVRLTSDFSGETVTFEVDGDPYDVVLRGNGTTSQGKLQIPAIGAGPHVVELVDPPGCFPATNINCRVAADDDPEWDALEAEYAALEQNQQSGSGAMLRGNYPNPSNPSTTIRYAIPDGPVSLRVYNMLGEVVRTLVDEYQSAGEYSESWNGTNEQGMSVSSGMYFYRLTANGISETRRLLLIK